MILRPLFSRVILFNKAVFYSTSSKEIVLHRIGPVTTIGIDISHKKNEISQSTFKELNNAFLKFEEDDTSTAALLFGIGGNFCSGCSPDAVLESKNLFALCSKPIVAGISGYATNFGFELALFCDLRVMEQTAQIGLNSYPTQMSKYFYERLVSIVGLSHALDISLTGRNLSTKEALDCGLINRMVDCGAGIGQGLMLAKTVGKYPKEALKNVKAEVYSVC